MTRAISNNTFTSLHWLEMIFGFLPALVYSLWLIWDFSVSAFNRQFSVFLISMVVLGILGAYSLMSSIWNQHQIRHKAIYILMLSGILIETLYFVAALVLDTQPGNFETLYTLYLTVTFLISIFAIRSIYLLARGKSKYEITC
jgi:thiosulfate reductase cytochrome b subunit